MNVTGYAGPVLSKLTQSLHIKTLQFGQTVLSDAFSEVGGQFGEARLEMWEDRFSS